MKRVLGIALALSVAAGCEGRAPTGASVPKAPRTGPKVVLLDLTGGVPEREDASLLGPPSGHRRSLETLLAVVGTLQKEPDAKGVLVKLGGAEVGLARAQEIGGALERVRRQQKVPVYCHADALSNATAYLVARGCDKVWVSPAGEVATVGIAAQVVYLRKLLGDELHLSVDVLQVGKFKGAEEPFTRDGPSDEARSSLEAVLADLRRVWLDGMSAGRGRPGVAAAAEDGPFSPWTARDRGLIDEVGYADDAAGELKKLSGAVREEARFGTGAEDGGGGLDDMLKALAGGGGAGDPTVGLIRASGSIAMGGGGGLLGEAGITERELGKQIAAAQKNDAIKAVVLRIDSPGGSALASDLLWHQLMALRKSKPLVVSVGEMAASGGYYLASTGQEIFADSSSIVGSIGVVGGKVGVGDALERLGVHAETFPANRDDPNARYRAAYASPLVPWNDATRSRVYETMVGIYDLFLRRVAEGRTSTVEKIAPFAEGRIFAGDEALRRGLVDHEGGLTAALRRARELGKLPEGARVTVLSSRPRLLDILGLGDGEGDGASSSAGEIAARIASPVAQPGLGALHELAPALLPFAQSFGPLLGGERTLVVLPYALFVR